MGGCRALPRSCAPPDPYTLSSDEQINAQVVKRFIDQVWNYRWQAGDEYYFLPPALRSALGEFLHPNYVRYRGTQTVAGQLGALKRGSGPYGLGRCVKRVHELAPDLVVSLADLIAQGDRVVAVLRLDSANPPVGPKPFRATASVMYCLAGPPQSRKIVEDWATSERAFLEE